MTGAAPARPKARTVVTWLGVITVAAVIAAIFDRDIALYGAGLPWEIADAARSLSEMGQAEWTLVPATALFLWAWRSGRDNLARWAFLLGVTVAASGGIANLIKVICARWRPMAFIEGDEYGFVWFATGSVRASFPSGHSTTAGAAVLVLALWFPRWRWVAFAWGLAIALSRIVLSMHFATDVIAGLTLGALTVIATLAIWWRVSPSTIPRAMNTAIPRSSVALVWTAILGGTLLRLFAGRWLPLGIDEAYEVATCQSVALSGFDHPPLVYWLTRLGLWLSGSGPVDPLFVRLPFIALFALTSWFVWRLTRLCFSERAGAWCVVLLQLSALFSVAHGGWALPDGPLLCASMAMALVLAKGGVLGTLPAGGPPWSPWRTWLLAGAALGLAALAKYQAVLLGASVALYLVSTREGRRALAHPAPWIGALLAVAIASPVVIWNLQNDWASLRFQGARAHSDGGLHFLRPVEMLAAQAAIILPWIWGPLLWEWIKSLGERGRANPRWFLACMAGLPIVVFPLISLWSPKGLPHWSAVGYLFAFPLLGLATAHELAHGQRQLVRNWLRLSTVAILLAVPIGVSQAASGWLTRTIALPSTVKDPTLEALDWTSTRSYIERRIAARIATQLTHPFVPPAPWLIGEVDEPPCDDTTTTTVPPVHEAAVAPARPFEVFAPPPPDAPSWTKTPAKVTRPPRPPNPDPPPTAFDADVMVRCGEEGLSANGFFVAGCNWRDAGKLGTAVAGLGIPVACLSDDDRQFGWATPRASLVGDDALVFVRSDDVRSASTSLEKRFRWFSPVATIRLVRGTTVAEVLTVFCGLDYQGP